MTPPPPQSGAPGAPPRGLPRTRRELLVLLALLLPPMALAPLAGAGRETFALTAIATILNDAALTALVLFFVWSAGERIGSIGWTSRRLGRELLVGMALYPPLLVLLAVFSWLLGAAGLEGPHAPPPSLVARSPAELTLAAVLVVVVAWAEETIFRGYLLARLRAVTGSTVLAVALSALLFAVGHTYSGPAGVAGVTLLAIVFSLVYLWRRSLVAPIVLHFLQDFLALVVLPWLRPS